MDGLYSVRISEEELWADADGVCAVRPSSPSDVLPADFVPSWQLARVTVDAHPFLLVYPVRSHDSKMRRKDIASRLRSHAEQDRCSLVIVDAYEEGFVRGRLIGTGARDLAAAALSAVRYSWSWDDSPRFDIVIDARRFVTNVEYERVEKGVYSTRVSATSVSPRTTCEVFLTEVAVSDVVDWLRGIYPSLAEVDVYDTVRIFQFEHGGKSGAVTITERVEGHPLTSVFFSGHDWPSDLSCARQAARHFGVEVLCDAGSDSPQIFKRVHGDREDLIAFDVRWPVGINHQ